MGAPSWIKTAGSIIHRFVSGIPVLATIYMGAWRVLIGRFSPHFRQQLLNSLSSVPWPECVLKPQQVILGTDTKVRLVPHNGEFDFCALLGGRLKYEQEVFDFLDHRIGQYDIVIEIGANVGVFTLYFGSKLKSKGGRVFAFEPSQKAFTRLVQNLLENQLANVFCFNVAVGDKTEFATFHEPEGHLTNGSLISDFAGNFNKDIKSTQVLVLNAAELIGLVSSEKRVLVKIDAEGYEAPLIKALSPFFERIQPDVMLEVLPEFEAEIDASVREAAAGYQRYAITGQGLLHQSSLHAIEGRDCFLTPSDRATIS